MAFFASALVASCTLIAAIVPGINLPGRPGTGQTFPAPPGYLLPWAGGEIHGVTQGEETTFTHNGLNAYAFDFDLHYQPVLAARAGKVIMAYGGSDSGGCSRFYQNSANYVVIDHGDGTAGLYLHLAYNSPIVKVGDVVAQGQPVAMSGETGVTCSDDGKDPGPHLHFMVERVDPGHYLTQSLPVAFDDISKNSGVPVEGQSYVSGNYGPDKTAKIKLTAWRTPRLFDPKAVPANADLIPSEPVLDIAPPPATDTPVPTDTPLPLAESLITPEATSTRGVHTATSTPEPTQTPVPTPAPTDTPPPPPTSTSTAVLPPPTDTPVPPPPTDTPVPPSPSDTPQPAPTATPTP